MGMNNSKGLTKTIRSESTKHQLLKVNLSIFLVESASDSWCCQGFLLLCYFCILLGYQFQNDTFPPRSTGQLCTSTADFGQLPSDVALLVGCAISVNSSYTNSVKVRRYYYVFNRSQRWSIQRFGWRFDQTARPSDREGRPVAYPLTVTRSPIL